MVLLITVAFVTVDKGAAILFFRKRLHTMAFENQCHAPSAIPILA